MEYSPRNTFLCLPISLLLTFTIFSTSSASLHDIPKPVVQGRWIPEHRFPSPRGRNLMAWKTYFYNQTIDHFNYRPESYGLFQQRYMMSDEYWGGPKNNSPIFVYLGAEQPIDYDLDSIGFLYENASLFNALIVYIEHRYYGMSNPVASMLKSLSDPEIRGYFDSAQALADYAEVIMYLKKQLNAQYCPIVVIGASYGGMLASWFRLKYPHLALGALASSAPILMHFRSPETYFNWVSKDYNDTNKNCHKTIKQSWDEMDKLASRHNGLLMLSQKFNTCKNVTYVQLLKNYLVGVYAAAAQYDAPPGYPVSKICKAVDESPKGTDILDKVASGLAAVSGFLFVPMNKNRTCFAVTTRGSPSETELGWPWQACSEIVNAISISNEDSMFPVHLPFNLTRFIQKCNDKYGVPTRPFWLDIYYGGQDIHLVLKRFGSNIIFSNGLRDPYSQMSVLKNISETLVAIKTAQGSHCLDLLESSASDPKWLKWMRKKEVKIIEGWLSTYYEDLHAYLR